MFKRHSLAWLNDAGWEALRVVGVSRADAHQPIVQRWRQSGWPLIVRRRDADAADSEICLGIAAPPDAQGDKPRIPLRVRRDGIDAVREPLAIGETIAHAPPRWRDALERMRRECEAEAIAARVYGSLALQALTGQDYVRETSDIDLLLHPRDRDQLARMLALLRRYRAVLPLDGELMFPDGVAVAWKEWLQAGQETDNRVLAKRDGDVALLRVDDMLAGLEARSCPA